MNLDTGTVTAVVDASHLTVDGVGGRAGLAVFVPSSLAGAAMVGSMVNVLCDGDVNLLIGVTTGAWIGTFLLSSVADVPAGYLIADGSTFDAATYPFLSAKLGGTTLPNVADRGLIGKSGTKAIRSTGGAASVTLGGTNVPPHYHATGFTGATIREAAAEYSSGTVTVATTATPGNNTQADTGSPTSFSVQDPYYAAAIYIKAA